MTAGRAAPLPAPPRRLRVLCFGRFYDSIPGGMQRHAEQLFAALSDAIDFVHLVPSRDRHGGRLMLGPVPVIRTPSLNVDGSLALSPSLIAMARRLHRSDPFDVVHLHFPDPMSHLASMAIPTAVPRVITWHADIKRHRGLLRLYRPLLEAALRGAHAIIVPSPSHVDSSEHLHPIRDDPRIEVIPFGFDLGRFTSTHPSAASVAARLPQGRRILALGRHVYYKGFDVLITAMRAIHSDVSLVIGGTGPLTGQWQALAASLGLSGRVRFVGHIDEAELPAWYQACDLFCLPSTSAAEAFGIVQLEAMAAGLPVVSTRLNNGVDFVNVHRSTGLTVTPGDSEALADAINGLLDSPASMRAYGAHGRQRALEDFSLAAMGSRTLAIYRRATEAASAR